MKKNVFLLLFLAMGFSGLAQITGTVTDKNGTALIAVNIYIEDSYIGTATNQQGVYLLDIKSTGSQNIVFQYLGYKTQIHRLNIDRLPFELNVEMEEEINSLDQVVISSGENPANQIIRNAITNRQKNLDKAKAYTADFYSKGIWAIENLPDKIAGIKLNEEDLGELGLDSTRSGIIYLSETKSKIKFRAPDDFHEHILASKVSGNDNGFSLNSARQADFSFYKNTLNFNAALVSPIASYAFNYYRYKLVSANFDELGHMINKIEVLPKRPDDHVFSGYIYIVEDSWEIYGVELKTTGTSVQIPVVKEMNFNQSFAYSKKEDMWVKISQDVNFTFGLFGFTGSGQFIAVYNDYDFNPVFDKDSFKTGEVMSWEQNANKKDSIFWETIRPVALTEREVADYIRKDSISKVHESPAYKDSMDRKSNRFSVTDILFGYTYRNSLKEHRFSVSSPLMGVHFNTVQGWNLNLNTEFVKSNEEENTYWRLFSDMGYGFADEKFRISGGYTQKFNNHSKPVLTVQGGVKLEEINDTKPISLLVNDVANIFFERNYLKLYEKQFVEAKYSEELFNGFRFHSSAAWENRKALLNATDHVIRHDKNGGYTSNDPFAPNDFDSYSFADHHITKLKVGGRMNFGQKYYAYPTGKYNVINSKYPTLYLDLEAGLASDISDYNFAKVQLAAQQNINVENKGRFSYRVEAGKFFDGDDISLVDYKHFNGNQLRVTDGGTYLDKFNLLPYYMLSTNDQYAQAHIEHDFRGWILGKIPGVNKLNFNLVVGAHALWTGGNKPYQEVSIGLDNLGIGMFRFLRVDYVHSFYGDYNKGAFVFGIKLLNN